MVMVLVMLSLLSWFAFLYWSCCDYFCHHILIYDGGHVMIIVLGMAIVLVIIWLGSWLWTFFGNVIVIVIV